MHHQLNRFIERRVVFAFTLICALVWLLAKLASEVLEGDATGMDLWIMQALRHGDKTPIGPAVLVDIARDITALGSAIVLSLFVIVAAAGLLLARRKFMACAVVASSVSGIGADLLMKSMIARGRPDVSYRLVEASGMSFPSGHTMMSSVIYLTLAILVAKASRDVRFKLFVVGVAMTLATLVGLSRIYLGVHWFSDVLGGWVAGALWALACWLVVDRWGHRVSPAKLDQDEGAKK